MSALVDRLGSLLSRQFVLSYFVPVLIFAFINALLLAWAWPVFRHWAPEQFTGLKGLFAIPVLIGVAVVAYVMLAANVFLRQVLEGRLPKRLRTAWEARQRQRRDDLQAAYR